MPSQNIILDVQNLVAGYGEMEILHAISLHVCKGECVVIIGPNGAGKSTVIKSIMGLNTIMGGKVILGNLDITGLAPEILVKKGISYVPQVHNIFPNMTVLENLEMGGYVVQGSLQQLIKKVYDLFPVLEEKQTDRASSLSGGQRQMLAMGKALMVEPKLILLDEPTAGVSPMNRDIIFESITTLQSAGVPILMVEQNVREALHIADRGYILVDGRNRMQAKGSELLAIDHLGSLFFEREECS